MNIKESMTMIKNVGMESLSGPVEIPIKDNIKMMKEMVMEK